MPSATLQQPYTRKHAPDRVQLAEPISNNIRQVFRCWLRGSKRPIPSLTGTVVVVVSPVLTSDRTITSQNRFPGLSWAFSGWWCAGLAGQQLPSPGPPPETSYNDEWPKLRYGRDYLDRIKNELDQSSDSYRSQGAGVAQNHLLLHPSDTP